MNKEKLRVWNRKRSGSTTNKELSERFIYASMSKHRIRTADTICQCALSNSKLFESLINVR